MQSIRIGVGLMLVALVLSVIVVLATGNKSESKKSYEEDSYQKNNRVQIEIALEECKAKLDSAGSTRTKPTSSYGPKYMLTYQYPWDLTAVPSDVLEPGGVFVAEKYLFNYCMGNHACLCLEDTYNECFSDCEKAGFNDSGCIQDCSRVQEDYLSTPEGERVRSQCY